MPRTISRRTLLATVVNGAVVWLGGYLSFFTAHANSTYSIADYSELITLCMDLRCPKTIGKACLLVLPMTERSRLSLARTILAGVSPAEQNHSPPDVLAQAIRERSRADFREGKVVTVDDWIFSLTETRVYALAALLVEPRASIA